jgi:hypothetical protein
VREFVIGEKKKAKLVKSAPSLADDSEPVEPARALTQPPRAFKSGATSPARGKPAPAPPPPRASTVSQRAPAPVVRRPAFQTPTISTTVAPRAARSARRYGQRQFVVRYDEAFVGFFEADTDISPREAFIRVAADLGASDDSFDPDRLEIYKPVLLRGARPQNGIARVKGKLRRVAAKST